MTVFLPPLTLVLGGAASGKSAYAESLVVQSGLERVYIATAQAFDAEMTDKIADHRKSRGPDWTTVEEPYDLAPHLAGVTADQIVLLDCATMWLSNHLLAENDIKVAADLLLNALAACPAPVIVVSNEVGASIVPETPLGRRFREAQGRLNQDLAARSDLVVAVMAGLPLVLKGSLP